MSDFDQELYSSKEYRERVKRNFSSLCALPACEQLQHASESMAYWQLRCAHAEESAARRTAPETRAGHETSSAPGRPMTLRECMDAEDGGIPFQPMEANTDPLTHQEIFSAVHHWASEIVRVTAAVPTQCTAPSEEASR